jgi:hypothetical protein
MLEARWAFGSEVWVNGALGFMESFQENRFRKRKLFDEGGD